jgi:iron complex transport system substrate-binding protein
MTSNKRQILFGLLICLHFIFHACNNDRQPMLQNKQARVISLAPHITEIIYAMGQEEHLVAVTDFCSYPPVVTGKDRIGGLLNPNIEKIVALQPTHLFGQPAHENLNLSLKSFGLSIVMMPNETLEDLFTTIHTIGSELGCQIIAQHLVQQISDSLNYQINRRKLPTAMLVIGKNAGELKNIMVAGQGTFLDEIWQKAGGENIYRDLAGRYQTITLESIFARDPDIIILFDPSATAGVNRGNFSNEWLALGTLKAFKKNNVYTLGGDYVLIPGPRVIFLAADMREVILLSEGEQPRRKTKNTN